jgi:Na+-translocating ferredoxin:NAD+ oxidoreductase RnfD subunit
MSAVAATPASGVHELRLGLQRFLQSPKGHLLLVFIPLVAAAGYYLGYQPVLTHLLGATVGACAIEVELVRRWRGKLILPTSALLSGAIVAFVLSLETPLIVTILVGALATVSKHVVRTRRGHVFNPAALALLVAIVGFGTGQSWWGALPDLPWPFLIALLAGGVFVADRTYKLPLVLVFSGSYFALLTLVALNNPSPVAELFRAPFAQATLFLACFMLTDPPTAPGRVADQIWYGILVALASVLAQLGGAGQAYLLVGLLLGNATLAAHQLTERPGVTDRPD